MSARRRATVVTLSTPVAGSTEITEHESELEDLANAVALIRCGNGVNNDPEQLESALSHVERTRRRLSDQVGDTERRLGWQPAR